MASTGAASPTTLDPLTLPHISFARADDLLARASYLRADAESLKVRAEENEDKAKQYEECAAQLQSSAEDDRECIQAELDRALEYHADVVKDFLHIPDHRKELEALTVSVEEGRTYLQEVVAFGEKLQQIKSAKLQMSQHNEANLFRDGFQTKTEVIPGSQTTDKPQGWLNARSIPTAGISTWRQRIGSLLKRGASSVDYVASWSVVQPKAPESYVVTDPKTSAALLVHQESEHQRHDARNIADTSRHQRSTVVDFTSLEVLQNSKLPCADQAATTETIVAGQTQSEKNKPAAKGRVNCATGGIRSDAREDSTTTNIQEVMTGTSRKRRRENDKSIGAGPSPKRCKEVEDLAEEEKAAAFYAEEARARYCEFFASMGGKHNVKISKLIRGEMAARINSSRLSVEKKTKLIVYVKEQVNALFRGIEKEVTEEEKAAVFNESDVLARYRELKVAPYATRLGAKETLKQEMTSKITNDDTVSFWRKHKLTEHVKDQINALSRKEHERLKQQAMKQRKQVYDSRGQCCDEMRN